MAACKGRGLWLSHRFALEALETRLLGGGYVAERAGCCPIAFEQTSHIPAPPERRPHQCKEPGEAMSPVMGIGQKAQPFRQAPAEGLSLSNGKALSPRVP